MLVAAAAAAADVDLAAAAADVDLADAVQCRFHLERIRKRSLAEAEEAAKVAADKIRSADAAVAAVAKHDATEFFRTFRA